MLHRDAGSQPKRTAAVRFEHMVVAWRFMRNVNSWEAMVLAEGRGVGALRSFYTGFLARCIIGFKPFEQACLFITFGLNVHGVERVYRATVGL